MDSITASFWKRSSNLVDIDNWMVVSLAMASSSRLRLDLERIDSAMEAQQEHQLLGRAVEREKKRR